jgi:hypothetical protein
MQSKRFTLEQLRHRPLLYSYLMRAYYIMYNLPEILTYLFTYEALFWTFTTFKIRDKVPHIVKLRVWSATRIKATQF